MRNAHKIVLISFRGHKHGQQNHTLKVDTTLESVPVYITLFESFTIAWNKLEIKTPQRS